MEEEKVLTRHQVAATVSSMKTAVFDYRFMLIPLAVPALTDVCRGVTIRYRVVLIFGFRVAYWSIA